MMAGIAWKCMKKLTVYFQCNLCDSVRFLYKVEWVLHGRLSADALISD